MRLVVSAVDVEHDERSGRIEAIDALPLQLAQQSIQLAAGDVILEPRQSRLRRQWTIAAAARELQYCIVAKLGGVVAVLVTEADLVDPLANLLLTLVSPLAGVAAVIKQR